MLRNVRKRARRRSWPIHGYVGANGSGKSAAMVWDTLPSLDAGRLVLSTVRLLDYRNPRPCDGTQGSGDRCVVCGGAGAVLLDTPTGVKPDHYQAHPGWVPFKEWEQFLASEHTDVLMDEVSGVASSRESQAMPSAVVAGLQQCRRADVTVRWSAPAWARSDKIIRETSQAVTHCVGFMARVDKTEPDRLWRQRRLFRWSTFDADQFEDFSVGKRQQLRPEFTPDFYWGPGSPAFKAYDTLDAVTQIGTVSESGRCYRCGGTRRAPACHCDAPAASLLRGGRRSRGPAQRSARGASDAPTETEPTTVPAHPDAPASPARKRGRRRHTV